jgi:hypothetical protein
VLGVPKHVTASDGSAADVTLNGVRYAPISSRYPSTIDPELAVLDITVTGMSSTPFNYSEDQVVFNYGGGLDPYNHPNDTNLYGPSAMEDYTPFLPPNPLRVGSVATGQTARGLVILRMSKATSYTAIFADSRNADRLVQWNLVSK